MLQRVAACIKKTFVRVVQCVAACCSVLQYVVLRCSVMTQISKETYTHIQKDLYKRPAQKILFLFFPFSTADEQAVLHPLLGIKETCKRDL